MPDNSKELLTYPLQVLTWVGQNPEQNRVVYFVATGLYLFFGTIGLILTILQIIYANGNIIIIAQNCEALVLFTALMGKTLVGAIKMKNFLKMIGDVKSFWQINNCVKALQVKLENTFRRILHLEHLYLRIAGFTTVLALTAGFITKKLPTGLWTMENHKALYSFTLLLQEVLIPFLAVYNVAYDTLFLSFCILLKSQFKVLNYFLEDLEVSIVFSKQDQKMYMDKLISYVEYHKFLLRFSQNMRDTYSPVLLIQYSIVLIILCTEMYVVFESKDMFLFIRFSLAMIVVLFQLAFYCIPTNYVTDEAVSVSQGIYGSDWHSKHIPALKTIVPLIIQRSQKEITFRAGGLVEVNCRTILNVIRVSYSVCAIMRALKNS